MARTAGKGSRSSSSVVSEDAEKRELMKKLSLWHSLTQITTHEQLEPILAKLGFVPGPLLSPPLPHGAVWWQSYIYTYMAPSSRWTEMVHTQQEPPTVKLPYPNIDGLHRLTYTAFFEALDFYLERVDRSFVLMRVAVNESELQKTRWMIERTEERRYMYKPTMLDRETMELIINKLFDDNAEKDVDVLLGWRKKKARGSNRTSTTFGSLHLQDIVTQPPKE